MSPESERLIHALRGRIRARRALLEAGLNWLELPAAQLGPDCPRGGFSAIWRASEALLSGVRR